MHHYGRPPFAVCQGHTVKPQKPTANPLSYAAHGKAHTATRDRQSRPLPCAIYRAHGKGFAVCNYRPTTKKLPPRNDDVAMPLPCALLAWHTAKFKYLPCATVFAHGKDWHICRAPWFLHTAKVPEPIFFL